MAVASVLVALLAGPLGALLAIILGLFARTSLDRPGERARGQALATLGIVLGIVLLPAWGGLVGYYAYRRALREQARMEDESEEPREATPPSGSPHRQHPHVLLPPTQGPSAPAGPLEPSPRISQEGAITLVDLGGATTSLADELARQRAEAARARETLVVMTTAAGCDPCRGVDTSLADPRMQAALAKVRLVRVDVRTFEEDLESLRIPQLKIPGFYLLRLDLTPKDGIDGGEWDDDIPKNIAPVLGAFVREKYTRRRERWTPLPATGVTL
jgi:hypothetical protein